MRTMNTSNMWWAPAVLAALTSTTAAAQWDIQPEIPDWRPDFRAGALGSQGSSTADPEDTCPAASITAADCMNPLFLQSACAEAQADHLTSFCPTVAEAAQEAAHEQIPLQTLANVALTGTTQGRLFLAETLVDGTLSGVTLAGGTHLGSETSHYDTNCAVQSCDEYVYEKYFDYERFRRANLALGDDVQAAFAHIYSAEGIAGRQLQDFDRTRDIGGVVTSRHADTQNAYAAFRDMPLFEDWWGVYSVGGLPGMDVNGPGVDDDVGCTVEDDGTVRCPQEHLAAVVRINQFVLPYDVDIVEKLAAIPSNMWPPENVDVFDWHQQQAALLDEGGMDLAMQLQVEQERFRRSARLHNELRDRIANLILNVRFHRQNPNAPGFDAHADNDAVRRLQDVVVAYRRNLVDVFLQLQAANRYGCLEGGVTPCDWSPQWLVDDVRDQFAAERAADFHNCQEHTNDAFGYVGPNAQGGAHWLQEQAETMDDSFCVGSTFTPGGPRCRLTDNYGKTWRTVEDYFVTVTRWKESLELPIDPETGKPLMTLSKSDVSTLGNAEFGAFISYGFSWTTLPSALSTGGAQTPRGTGVDTCSLGIGVGANMEANVTAFGYEMSDLFGGAASLVSLESSVTQTSAGVDPDVDFEVLGIPVAVDGRESSNGLQFNLVQRATNATEGHPTAFQDDYLTWVGSIPFTLSAGISGEAGVVFTMRTSSTECSGDDDIRVEAHVNVEPFAAIDAFASIALGVPGLSLGVRTDLTLVQASLPFSTTAVLDSHPDEDRYDIELDLPLRLELLKGSVSLQAEALFKTWRKRLVSWPGLTIEEPLFAQTYHLPLGVMLGSADEDTGRRPADSWSTGQACAMPPSIPSPAFYVPFDDVTLQVGAPVDVVSGNALAEVTAGTVGLAGVRGQAMRLAGGAYAATGPANPRSWSVWVKGDDTATPGNVVTLGQGLALTVTDTQPRKLRMNGTCAVHTPRVDLLDDEWHLVSLSWDSDADVFDLYVDGEKHRRQGTGCNAGASTLYAIGGVGSANVVVDDIAVWTETLDQRVWAEEYARGRAGRPMEGHDDTAPLLPMGLLARQGQASALLSWVNPPSFGQSGGYFLVRVYGSDEGVPTPLHPGRHIYTGTETATTRRDLAVGSTWHFRLVGVQHDGTEVWGESVSVDIVDLPPEPVRELTATSTPTSVRLHWQAPATTFVDHYVVVAKRGAVPQDRFDGTEVHESGATDMVFTDVERGDTWGFAVYTVDLNGPWSAASTRLTVIPNSADPVVADPGVLDAFTATAQPGAVLLSWTSSGTADAFYEVVVSSRAGPPRHWREVATYTSTTVTDLTPGIPYAFMVRAVNHAGVGGGWVSALGTPDETLPTAVRNLQAVLVDGEVTLSWEAPENAPFATYEVRAVSNGTNYAGGRVVVDGVVTTVTDVPPALDIAQTYAVRARRVPYASPWKAVDVTLPPTPTPVDVEHYVVFGLRSLYLPLPDGLDAATSTWSRSSGPSGRVSRLADGGARALGDDTRWRVVVEVSDDSAARTVVVDGYPRPTTPAAHNTPDVVRVLESTEPAGNHYAHPVRVGDYLVTIRDSAFGAYARVFDADTLELMASTRWNDEGFIVDDTRLLPRNVDTDALDIDVLVREGADAAAIYNGDLPKEAYRHARQGWLVERRVSNNTLYRRRWRNDFPAYGDNGAFAVDGVFRGAWSLGDGRVALHRQNLDGVTEELLVLEEGLTPTDLVVADTFDISAAVAQANITNWPGDDLPSTFYPQTLPANADFVVSTADEDTVGMVLGPRSGPRTFIAVSTSDGSTTVETLETAGAVWMPTPRDAFMREGGHDSVVAFDGRAMAPTYNREGHFHPTVQGALDDDVLWVGGFGSAMGIPLDVDGLDPKEMPVPFAVIDMHGADGALALVLDEGTQTYDSGDWVRDRTVAWHDTVNEQSVSSRINDMGLRSAIPQSNSAMTCFALLDDAFVGVVQDTSGSLMSSVEAFEGQQLDTASSSTVSGMGACRGMVDNDARAYVFDDEGTFFAIDVDGATSVAQQSTSPLTLHASSDPDEWRVHLDDEAGLLFATFNGRDGWAVASTSDLGLRWLAAADVASRYDVQSFLVSDGALYFRYGQSYQTPRLAQMWPQEEVLDEPVDSAFLLASRNQVVKGVGTVQIDPNGIAIADGPRRMTVVRPPVVVDDGLVDNAQALTAGAQVAFDGETLWMQPDDASTPLHGIPWPLLSIDEVTVDGDAVETVRLGQSTVVRMQQGAELAVTLSRSPDPWVLAASERCAVPDGSFVGSCSVDQGVLHATPTAAGFFAVDYVLSHARLVHAERIYIEVMP